MREEDDEDERVVEVRHLGVDAEHLMVDAKLVVEDRILAGVARKLVGGDRQLVRVKVQDELDLDHPSHSDAGERVLKRRGRQPLREHVSTMKRCLFVDEGVLRVLDEDFVRHAQRYSFSAGQGPKRRAVAVPDGSDALRVVLEAAQAHRAPQRALHEELRGYRFLFGP